MGGLPLNPRDLEEELRAHIRRFEDIAANAQEWIWEVDSQGRYTYVSPVVESILGFTPSEILEKHFYDLFHPDDREALKRAAFEGFARKQPFREFVNRNVHKDGHIVWLSTSGVPVLDNDGNLVGYRGADSDISQQIRANEELARSEEELRLAFESSKDAIFWADPGTGRITRCNKAAEALLEMSRDDIVGMPQHAVHPPDKVEMYVEMFRRHIESGGSAPDEAEVITATGRVKPVEITASVPIVAGKPLIQGVFRDITESKRLGEERRRFEEKIQQTQRLESLGVLAGGIAHDFNNLLMGVLGNAGLALAKLAPEAPAVENVEKIALAAKRAAELTNQLLAYSGRGQFVIELLNLSELVEEMGHLLNSVILKNVRLSYQFGEELPPIRGDAAQIRQVVMNLITNASDAIGDGGGTIRIKTGAIDVDDGYLMKTFGALDLTPGTYVFVEVSDTGEGMDPQVISRIFDPFFSTKRTGRGLGLAATVGIVRGHHGAIKVYSEIGQGSSFKVLFPASDDPHAKRRVQPRQALGWRGHGLILLVDDEEIVRETTRMMLEAAGFSVLLAEDGLKAVQLFRERTRDVKAVLLDMTMPNLSGQETFTELRRLRSDVPVVLSSGYNEQDAISRFSGRGLAGFIQKPYTPQALIDMLRGVLDE